MSVFKSRTWHFTFSRFSFMWIQHKTTRNPESFLSDFVLISQLSNWRSFPQNILLLLLLYFMEIIFENCLWPPQKLLRLQKKPLSLLKYYNFAGSELNFGSMINLLIVFLFQESIDLGEIMFSLCYLPTAGRMTLTVIKCRNLKAMDITGASGESTFLKQ